MLAPSGSTSAAHRPATWPGGAVSTGPSGPLAPGQTALAVAAAAAATLTYLVACGAPSMPGVGQAMAATSKPCRLATRYLSSIPGGSLFSNSQPNTPA